MSKKSTVEVPKSLAERLTDDLNKHFKSSGKIAFTGNDVAPTTVSEWVSTGSSMLDLAISNRPNGGFPVGRLTEITGWEASGKSLLAAHAIVDTQRKGGLGVYFDVEQAMSEEFFTSFGIDYTKLVHITLSDLAEVYEAAEIMIEKVRREDKNQLITIVIDSVMGAKMTAEKEADYKRKGWDTDKALLNSLAMRKLTDVIANERICFLVTNQLRDKLGVTFGNKSTTSGGKAIGFHASVRLELLSVGQIKPTGSTDVIGIKTRAKVFKNRVGPPYRSADFDIYFNSGIDNWGSWLKTMIKQEMVTQNGSWYTYDGIKFQSKDFYKVILSDEERKKDIYEKICDKVIMEYKINENIGVDDVEIEEISVDEDRIPEEG